MRGRGEDAMGARRRYARKPYGEVATAYPAAIATRMAAVADANLDDRRPA
jgi:hypothetical protein